MNFESISNLFLLFLTVHLVLGETSCQEKEETKCAPDGKSNKETNQNSEVKELKGNSNRNHKNPEFRITTEKLLIPSNNADERREGIQSAESPDDGRTDTKPRFLNPETERQNLFVSGEAGGYNIQLESLRPSKEQNLNAALGAISAHILNPRTDQEYIPYPPNGDPYNYLAYRGHPQTTEPPVVRAYEAATNFNYGGHPPANYPQHSSNGVFPKSGYQQDFQSEFGNFEANFYRGSNIFDQGGFYSSVQTDLEPIFGDKFVFDEGRPIKRFA